MKNIFLLAAAMSIIVLPISSVQATTTSSIVTSGDLIRGESFSSVYYMGADGFRYVFPNEKTYFTWFSDFSSVKFISDSQLGTIQIGGNVTYKPGSKMIKINTDPKTYAVSQGGVLNWVTSEAIAVELAGSDWSSQIDDVPDGFFSNYTSQGATLASSAAVASYQADLAAIISPGSINNDMGLAAPTVIGIANSSGANYEPDLITISAGRTVQFVNNSSGARHTATGDDGIWGTGTIEPSANFVIRFTTPGTYTYHCSYHTEMTGTIIVE